VLNAWRSGKGKGGKSTDRKKGGKKNIIKYESIITDPKGELKGGKRPKTLTLKKTRHEGLPP